MNGRQEKKFLRQLVTGYAELFEYDNESLLYLLTVATGESVQLEKRDSVIEGSQIYRDKRYEGLMKYLLKDCQQLINNNIRIEFTQGALSSYVRRYNKCAHPEIPSDILTNLRRLRLDFGIHGGWNFIKANGTNFNTSLPKAKGSGNGFQAGLLVQISYFNRLVLRTGLFYNEYDFNLIGPYTLGEYHFKHEFKSLDIPLNFRYSFLYGKVRPYFYGGIKMPIFLDKTIITQQFQQGILESESLTKIGLRKSSILNGGLGITLPLASKLEVNLNVGYERFYADLKNIRKFEANSLVFSAELVF